MTGYGRAGESGLGVLGAASLVAGGVKGFYDAQNKDLSSTVDNLCFYGPTLVHGSLGALGGLFIGGAVGGAKGIGDGYNHPVASALGGVALGAPIGVIVVGGLSAVVGAAETAIGYGIGYFLGAIF